jgi:ATP-dependent Lhr-like helicase
VLAEVDADAMLAELERERRAIRLRIAGEERWAAAEDAGTYRDAFGAAPPGGLPDSFLEPVDDPLERIVRRHAQTHGPFTTRELRERYAVDPSPALRELERVGAVVQGELRPGGTEREWCDPDVLRRLRRASLAVLRREIEPADQRAFARFAASWQGIDRHPAQGAGVDRLREVLVPLQGIALPVEAWERDVLPRRAGAYSPTWMDQLCASGELVWIGAGAIGRRSGRVALYFREDASHVGPPPSKADPPSEREHDLLRERLAAGACFFSDLLADVDLAPEALQEALWDLVWAGEVTNDAFAPLRAPRLTLARAQREGARRSGRRFASRRTGAQAQVQGRWSLVSTLLRDAPDPGERRRALAELLLERYGIVTREQVLAEGIPGGFAAVYDSLAALETLGVARRGYFVEGLGGAQFALPGAVERLRAQRPDDDAAPVVLAAVDPAQPYGAALPWPKRPGDAETRRPQRVAGAQVVLVGAEPIVYLERSGKGLVTLVEAGDPRLYPALEALAEHVRAGHIKRIGIERVDGEPVASSPLMVALVELGFRQSPRALTLSA